MYDSATSLNILRHFFFFILGTGPATTIGSLWNGLCVEVEQILDPGLFLDFGRRLLTDLLRVNLLHPTVKVRKLLVWINRPRRSVNLIRLIHGAVQLVVILRGLVTITLP